jgi:hypothetical protein
MSSWIIENLTTRDKEAKIKDSGDKSKVEINP